MQSKTDFDKLLKFSRASAPPHHQKHASRSAHVNSQIVSHLAHFRWQRPGKIWDQMGFVKEHLFAIFQCEAQSTALFAMMPSQCTCSEDSRSWTRRPLECTFSHPLSINHHLHFCTHLGATKCADHLAKMSKK